MYIYNIYIYKIYNIYMYVYIYIYIYAIYICVCVYIYRYIYVCMYINGISMQAQYFLLHLQLSLNYSLAVLEQILLPINLPNASTVC